MRCNIAIAVLALLPVLWGCAANPVTDVSNDAPARESGWMIGQIYRINRPAIVGRYTWFARPSAYFPEARHGFGADDRLHPERAGVPAKRILVAGTMLQVTRIELEHRFEDVASVYPVARCLDGPWAGNEIEIGGLGVWRDPPARQLYFESLGRTIMAQIEYINEVDLTAVR